MLTKCDFKLISLLLGLETKFAFVIDTPRPRPLPTVSGLLEGVCCPS